MLPDPRAEQYARPYPPRISSQPLALTYKRVEAAAYAPRGAPRRPQSLRVALPRTRPGAVTRLERTLARQGGRSRYLATARRVAIPARRWNSPPRRSAGGRVRRAPGTSRTNCRQREQRDSDEHPDGPVDRPSLVMSAGAEGHAGRGAGVAPRISPGPRSGRRASETADAMPRSAGPRAVLRSLPALRPSDEGARKPHPERRSPGAPGEHSRAPGAAADRLVVDDARRGAEAREECGAQMRAPEASKSTHVCSSRYDRVVFVAMIPSAAGVATGPSRFVGPRPHRDEPGGGPWDLRPTRSRLSRRQGLNWGGSGGILPEPLPERCDA